MLRRWLARRIRPGAEAAWPIDPAAAAVPPGWPGWPDGKQFCLVLTHDVESQAGVDNIPALMELERSRGFRSSFNLIPEGGYPVSPALREMIRRQGCEVGVHDLRHDGKLFQSIRGFRQRAARISQYAREWGAAGFRAGFMLHNLDWLHELGVRYDASTFDTDPFEPQPHGQNTIFPFFVSRDAADGEDASGRNGYVELPYTLPQDSTLFLILRETSPAIWIRKLDWIAAQRGMALLNVHPDYMRFGGGGRSWSTYPAAHYEQLLDHVRRTYGDRVWHPLPWELAEFVAGLERRPPRPRRARRVCMLTHSFYESDNRVTRYAEALAARGDSVDVVALQANPQMPREETLQGVRVFRLQPRYGKTERTALAYLYPQLRFLVRAACWIARRHLRRGYDLVHVHNIPDFLVFAALWPRLTGARVILDIHDIVPEFYGSKFGVRSGHPMLRLLYAMEWCSARCADHIILSNHIWLEKYAERNGCRANTSVFINNVDPRIFHRRPRTRTDGHPVVLFPGGLQWHQGLDIAIRAFQLVNRRRPDAQFHIYGEGNMKDQLVSLTRDLGLDRHVQFFRPLPVREIATLMAEADLGVVPKRADSFGNEAYSTKILEFMAAGVPVIASSTRIDRFYFDDTVVRFFPSGDVEALANAMLEMLGDPVLREGFIARAAVHADRQSWETRKGDYLRLVDGLCAGRGRAGTQVTAEAGEATRAYEH